MTWTDPGLWLWMGLFLAAAWLVPRRWATWLMPAVGLAFLAAKAPLSLGLLAALGLAGYALPRFAPRRLWPVVAVAFLVSGALAAARWGAHPSAGPPSRLAVLGLAFYGLRILHVAFESYKGSLPPCGWAEHARYLLFFPTLLAGPINRFAPHQRDERRRRWDGGLWAEGAERILYGFAKIVVLGNFVTVHRLGGWLAHQTVLSPWAAAYLGCLQAGLNLYFQFAGYSDVAIGLALMAGFRVEENFRWPFLACDIGDFWRRWHITLSEWCRDYLFYPVASATRSPYLGALASMLVLGLWHEFSPRYAVWGLTHGLAIALWQAGRRLSAGRVAAAPAPVRLALAGLGWLVTQNFVVLTFSITQAPSLGEAWRTLATVFSFWRS